MLFKLNSLLNSSFTLTLGYLNLALNNLALIIIIIIIIIITTTTTNNNNNNNNNNFILVSMY